MQGSARGEARKRQIVASALDLALERGFTALTLDEVARTANASKTTLMRFFGGRQGLIEATLALEMELVVDPLHEAAADLDRFGSAFQQVIFSDRCLGLLRFVLSEGATDASVGDAFRTTVLSSLAAMITPEVGRTLGLSPDDPHVTAAAEQFLSDLVGLELLRALSGGRPPPERLAALRERAVGEVG